MKALTFIEAVERLLNTEKEKVRGFVDRWQLVDIMRFYQQPFSADMLCNPLDTVLDSKGRPIFNIEDSEKDNIDRVNAWNEAESKVLFKGWDYLIGSEKYINNGNGINFQNLVNKEKYEIYKSTSLSVFYPRPTTLNDFISDCQRAGIELEFTDVVSKRYFKKNDLH